MNSPIAYVCIVSDFTLPTLEACLQVRPETVLLIVSNKDAFRDAARRLQDLLQEKLDCSAERVVILDGQRVGEPLDGDEILKDMVWLHRYLVPELEDLRRRQQQCVLNFTGGTKALAVGLLNCFDWDGLDYQPVNKPLTRMVRDPEAGKEGSWPFRQLDAQPVSSTQKLSVKPLDVARLYNSSARQKESNRIREAPGAAGLAKQIWTTQKIREQSLSLLFAGFDRVWDEEQDQHQQARVRLNWDAFFPPERRPESLREIFSWLESFRELLRYFPQGETWLDWDEQSITLPGNKFGKPDGLGKDWRNWISGDWLEQLAYEWLMASGIDREAIDCNLEAGETEKRSETNREIDLLVHYSNQTSLIEIKAGLPQGSRAATLEQQVSSLGTRFGKTRKALLIGPQLLDSLHRKGASRAQSFWLRCLASDVTLLLDQEQLKEFVHGRRVWPKYKDEELYIPSEFSEGWLNTTPLSQANP